MYDFMYYAPTKVFFGKDSDKDVGGTIKKEYDPKKIIVVYGGGSAKKSGLLDKVTGSIRAAGIDCIEFGGVEANPKVSYVSECVALCKKEKVDFIVAVGGGSVIDHCKSLSLCLANEGEPVGLHYAESGAGKPCAYGGRAYHRRSGQRDEQIPCFKQPGYSL